MKGSKFKEMPTVPVSVSKKAARKNHTPSRCTGNPISMFWVFSASSILMDRARFFSPAASTEHLDAGSSGL